MLFNLVAIVFVIGTLMHEPPKGLAQLADVLLGLTSISAVGYGKRVLPNEPISATLGLNKRKKEPRSRCASGPIIHAEAES